MGGQSACDDFYATEQECADACAAGGWDYYVWDPDGRCHYDGQQWSCVSPAYKWDQPPVPTEPQNVFYGWDEFSACCHRAVADDWVCNTDDPVTAIHWWGSYQGWTGTIPPDEPFDHFHIFIWTDVPAGGAVPFSHPGVVVHEIFAFQYAWTFAGWEYNPQTGQYESVFRYDCFLEPFEYFHQQSGENIYWLSIGAGYCGMPPGPNPWGWMTRPRDPNSPAPDAAVIMPNPMMIYTPPGTTWENIGGGYPIYWPDESHAWDMAFEFSSRSMLLTNKAQQLPNPDLPGLHAHDWEDDNGYRGIKLADDWICPGGDVDYIAWYGNYETDADGNEIRGAGIDYFHLSIHTNMPSHPWCLPRDPEVWGYDVPFVMTLEQDTGLVNLEDCRIYRYKFVLPEGFPQTAGEAYWLDVTAISADPTDPPLWRWQEAQRDFWPLNCPAAQQSYPMSSPWQSIEWPTDQYSDLAFEVASIFYGEADLKWSQPPQMYELPNAFNGWNEWSVYGEMAIETQIVADDWRCTSSAPVTDVHWWGSFIGWSEEEPPPMPRPMAFHLAIWTDVPAGGQTPFSHPGVVVWEKLCVEPEMHFVGWDIDPRQVGMPPEACFKFDCYLDDDEWFHQDDGENIYWVSISAVYSEDVPEYPFGWKTRPRDPQSPAPDAAVAVMFPTVPTIGSVYGSGYPITYPQGVGWDMAFQLTTEEPTEMVAKWRQPPYSLIPEWEGFDAPSNLWWPTKWEQRPDVSLPGLHAHDGLNAGQYLFTVLADDWQCRGGEVTTLSWWGNYEINDIGEETRGAGVDHFHLSIHACIEAPPGTHLPFEPPMWQMDVPFADAHETSTGQVNSEGSPIYLYEFQLPEPFNQQAGMYYWFDVTAVSVDPMDWAAWRWQEAHRGENDLCHAPGAMKTESVNWQPIVWPGDPPRYSDFAFRATSRLPEVNKVVADDFISDGRPIQALRWWGSYWDARYAPDYAYPEEPYVLDGWLVAFHHEDPSFACPPEETFMPTALGVYFVPADAVAIYPIDTVDCLGHALYEYVINFNRTCLLCAEVDPRTERVPAQPDGFHEEAGLHYWLSIQAVVGVTWHPPMCSYQDRILTGHLPSPEQPDGHFWGWHTSPGPDAPCDPLNEACSGKIVDFAPHPPLCWRYGWWNGQPWLCDSEPFPVQMAFELLTAEPDPCPCPGDINGDGIVNGLDIQGFVDCVLGSVIPSDVNCACADFNCTQTPDLGDLAGFVAELLNTTVCPAAGGPYLVGYGDSGCLPDSRGERYGDCGEDGFEFTVTGDTLYAMHRNATYNCCPDDIVVRLVAQGDVLRLTEEEILTTPCDCDCCYEVESTVANLAPGVYTVIYCWFDYETQVVQCHVEEIEIP